MEARFNTITFDNPVHNRRFHENSNSYGESTFFEVPMHVAFNPVDLFNTGFISKFLPVQCYAVSENMTDDNTLVYMITKPAFVKFNREMFETIFSELNVSVKVHNVRAYIESETLIPELELVREKTGKYLYALHKGGRDGALTHDQLAVFVAAYTTASIILESEIQNFITTNDYDVIV